MDELAGELHPFLIRFRRRRRVRAGWLLAQRSLWLACLAGALIQLAGRVRPIEGLWLWSLIPLAAWFLIVVGIPVLRRLPLMRVARRVDTELGLKERLSTALELEGWPIGPRSGPMGHPSLVALQWQDALVTAQAIDPRRAFPLRWLRGPLLLAGALAALMGVLAVLPNPMEAVLAERAAVAQAAEKEAEKIEGLRQEIENAQELTPEAREDLLRQLAELAEQLRANPGDREQALADLSRVEEALRQNLDPNTDARQAALESLAAQLQALAGSEASQKADLTETAEALEKLADELAEMDAAEREALARSLAQAAARAGQAGDRDLAQALATLAQAAQSGEREAGAQAAQAVAEALARARGELADQAASRRLLAELQEGRQAIAQAGQGPAAAQGQGQGQSQSQGQTQAQGQSQGQGQGQPGGGGGTQADTLPPASRVGKAERPQGEGRAGAVGELDQHMYVPWERRPGSGEELFFPGQDTGQGETQVREQADPSPGAPDQALLPYYEVYYDYLDAANQTIERGYIPPGLKDYVRDYFSQLEP